MSNIFVLCALVIISSIGAYSIPIATQLREGDIKIENLPKSLGENVAWKKWPNGVVPYEIASSYTNADRNLILSGMEMIRSKTEECITFVPRDSSHTHWLSIKSLDGCWSYVGRNYNPGDQEVSLDMNGCVYKDIVVHELCHAIGFWHEQNRPDRDNYVRINYANIESDLWSNFDKYNGDYFNTPYDYNSIMHYDEYAFSKNGLKTIVPLQSGVDIIPSGDRTDSQILSNYDIQAIKTSYQCNTVLPGTTTRSPVTTTRTTVTTTRPPVTTTRTTVTTTRPPVTTTRTPLTTTRTPVTTTTTEYSENGDFTFKLYNNKNGKFFLYWIDEDGYPQYYSSIKSGQTITQETYIGHEWILVESNFRKYSYFKIGSGKFKKNGVTVKTSRLNFLRF